MDPQRVNLGAAVRHRTPVPLEYLPAGVSVMKDVPYGPDKLQRLDVYRPEARAATPILVEFHGGGWRNGDKDQLGLYGGLVEKALEAGVAVVAANYRLTPESSWPAQAEDAVRTVQFVRSEAARWNIDRGRVALMGGSAGAHLAVWVAMHDDLADPTSRDPVARLSSRVSCAIDCWGPMDLTRMTLEGRMLAIGTQLFGCTAEEWDSPRIVNLRAEASPVNYITADDPPVMIVHDRPKPATPSERDWKTSDGHSPLFGLLLESRLEAAGVQVQTRFEANPETWCQAVLAFLRDCFGSAGS